VTVVSVAQDATEDRKHAAELRKMQFLQATQEAKMETERNMTDYFAHELRNPLSAIDSALSAMPDDLPDSSRSLVTGMQLCVRFMTAIMDNLLDVRRMGEGKVVLEPHAFNIREMVANTCRMALPTVKPGVALHMDCNTDGRDWVIGDERRIQQLLTNVLANAVKYTLNGSIRIHMEWEDEMVKFTCIDTGPGIAKSAQQSLFQRFVQRGGAPGTGLGLAIAKHLVDLAGGTILFDSDPSVSAGTTCTVHIPLSHCDPPDAANREDTLHRMLEAPLRFLIIDDVKMNRTMLKRRIQKKICPRSTIVEAATGEHALEICASEKFDVIIVDQYMEEAGGVMVGTDVVYAMRRMRINSIIIGCSGNDLDVEFGEAGVDWVWQKPMPSNEDIIAHLHAALATKRKL
jgi:CheY-like chemotaxis protein